MNYAYLGKRIREERCRLNMTQADLAAAVEVSPAYIGQIERGEKNATLDKMIKISNSLHVTLDYLLQDYVEDRDDNINRLILQFLHTKSVPEKKWRTACSWPSLTAMKRRSRIRSLPRP